MTLDRSPLRSSSSYERPSETFISNSTSNFNASFHRNTVYPPMTPVAKVHDQVYSEAATPINLSPYSNPSGTFSPPDGLNGGGQKLLPERGHQELLLNPACAQSVDAQSLLGSLEDEAMSIDEDYIAMDIDDEMNVDPWEYSCGKDAISEVEVEDVEMVSDDSTAANDSGCDFNSPAYTESPRTSESCGARGDWSPRYESDNDGYYLNSYEAGVAQNFEDDYIGQGRQTVKEDSYDDDDVSMECDSEAKEEHPGQDEYSYSEDDNASDCDEMMVDSCDFTGDENPSSGSRNKVRDPRLEVANLCSREPDLNYYDDGYYHNDAASWNDEGRNREQVRDPRLVVDSPPVVYHYKYSELPPSDGESVASFDG